MVLKLYCRVHHSSPYKEVFYFRIDIPGIFRSLSFLKWHVFWVFLCIIWNNFKRVKTLLCFWLLISCNLIIKVQETNSLFTIDSKAQHIPSVETLSTGLFAGSIMTNYTSEWEKLLAIYSWVTYNIRYDSDSIYVFNLVNNPVARITTVLSRRKGVCENFAAIFNEIAVKCNIRSYEIIGYTIQSWTVDKVAHTWCVVYLDNQWLFCDPTWDMPGWMNI